MGLEPTQACTHKILSLARLPVPTLPLFTPCKVMSQRKKYLIIFSYNSQLMFLAP